MEDNLFRQSRRLVSMFKYALEIMQDIKTEHDEMVEKLGESLADMEDFIEKQGVKVELCHLTNYSNFLTEEKMNFFRKKILDRGNNLKREIELELE